MLRLKNLTSILFACLLVAVNAQDQLKWWQTASFYQIYPRSFQDSDGDGVGDLRGIAQRLAYLKEIGITATWLSPVFTSPMVDFGYDVANLTEIDPLFGTMEDYEALVAKAKEIGVKIILDFVPNHTSDECEWFVKSAARDPEYKDWYVWHPGKIVNGVRTAPTNWIGVFRGSMWTWHEGRQEYYLHQFHRKQPDLNYRNPKVVEAMKDVLRFWLRRGASGFRIDAVPHVFEVEPDAQGNYPDEAKNPNVKDPEDYESLLHVYTTNRPETIDLVYQFRKVIDEMQAELKSDDLVLMTEAYAPLNVQMQYYGNATMDGAQIPFNFVLIENVDNKTTAYQFKQYIDTWLNNMPPGRTANWVIGNHDRTRAATRLGEDRVDMINMLLAVLPGCSVTYLGEEIGMSDVFISWEDTQDPQACQSNPENFERLTRDPVRTPFQWSSEKNAGFSNGDSTWLPVADNYKLVNVQRQRGIVYSHLNIFKSLRNLRQDPTMRSGATEVKALNANVLAVKRSVPGRKSFVAVMNLNDNLEVINLASAFGGLTNNLEYVLVTDRSPRRKGDWTHTDSMLLMPKEAVVLREV